MRLRWSWWLSAPLVFALAAFAQGTYTVKQVLDFVRSAASQKQQDKAVAGTLHGMKLSEKLTDQDVEQLLSAGVGPRTVDALKEMVNDSAGLKPPAAAEPVVRRAIETPSEEKQREVIRAAREYALNYTKSLPDFVCAQITDRFYDPTGKENFRKSDTIKTKLSYNGQRENYEVVLVNDQSAIGKTMESLGGTTSTGEFASLLRYIFEPASEAKFAWDRWRTLRGKVSYSFGYAVDQAHSGWQIVDTMTQRSIKPAYKGLVYIDRETGQILRVTLEAVDVPADFPIQVTRSQLDYDYADLSGQKFLLPYESVVRLDRGVYFTRNDVAFRSYRKFSADAVISFDK